MSSSRKMSVEELRYVSILEGLTGALAIDCLWDPDDNRITFVIKERDAKRVIGKGGTTIRSIKKKKQKNIDVIKYSKIPEVFVRNTLHPAKIKNVEIVQMGKKKIAYVKVASFEDKRIAIGRNGKVLKRARLLCQRHFGIDNIIIQ